LSTRAALFLASEGEGLHDVWYADVRPGRDGSVLDVAFVTNVTRSAGADDGDLLPLGARGAFVSRARGLVEARTTFALRGAPPQLTEGWSRVQRWQGAISNLQETGRTIGFGRTRYQLVTPEPGTFTVSDDQFALAVPSGAVVIDPDPTAIEPVAGAE